jgi:hypothetical protein
LTLAHHVKVLNVLFKLLLFFIKFFDYVFEGDLSFILFIYLLSFAVF